MDLHWELVPGCNLKDPLVHTHPNAIETYKILEGQMEFFIKDQPAPSIQEADGQFVVTLPLVAG